MLFVPSYIVGSNRKYTDSIVAENSWFPTLSELGKILHTFFWVVLAWVFFRSESLASAMEYLTLMFTKFDFPLIYKNGLYSVGSWLVLDWIFRKDERLNFRFLRKLNRKAIILIEILFILVVVYLISLNTSSGQFLYFQF